MTRTMFYVCCLLLAGCFVPGTYYDPFDEYVRGVRFFDRGDYATAKQIWEPLAAADDCDAQFRLGTLYFLALSVERDVPKALELWHTAADRGQSRAQTAIADVLLMSEKDTQLFCRIGCQGIPADRPAAYQWYLVAQQRVYYDNDKKYLASVIPRARNLLSSDETRSAETSAAVWTPHPNDCKPRHLL